MPTDHDCGHTCCNDRNNPHHDHWLGPDECNYCTGSEPLCLDPACSLDSDHPGQCDTEDTTDAG